MQGGGRGFFAAAQNDNPLAFGYLRTELSF